MREAFRRICNSVIEASDPAVLDGTRAIADAIERNAPRVTGKLAHSVSVVPNHDQPRGVAYATVKVTGGHEPQYMVAAVEYGLPNQVPNPFIRRSFASTKREALWRMIRHVSAAIRKG